MYAHRGGVADAVLIGGGVIALLGPALIALKWRRSALVMGGIFTAAWLAGWLLVFVASK